MPDLRFLAGVLAACALALPVHADQALAGVLAPVAAQPSPSALPADWQHGAFAEIYVRGYADGNGDGIGDLRGLIGKLDYLKSLGVSGLWLMPITRSTDHDHGYAVEDYRDIEREFGTLADFDELLAQAHARGIGVIVDYVINHSGNTHPLFLDAARDRGSPYRAWYLWQDQAPQGWEIFKKDPWNRTPTGYYFSQFSPHMPDWNLRNPQVMAWHLDNLRFWLNRGVDGFRFDAVAHLVENGKDATRDQPESLALMREAVRVVHAYPNRYVVCEATREEKRWAGDEGCGGAFALWMAPNFARAAQGDAKAVQALGDYFADAPAGMAAMASNHDLFAGERLWDQVGGDRAAYQLAAAAYLLAPATPFVYYGEEVGMSAAPELQGDARLRIPMSWTAQGFGGAKAFRPLAGNVGTQNLETESGRPDSLPDFYRELIALRRHTPALLRGRLERTWRWEGGWGYSRELEGTHLVALFDTGPVAAAQPLDFVGAGAACLQVFPAAPADAKTAVASFIVGKDDGAARVPARSVAVYRCAPPR